MGLEPTLPAGKLILSQSCLPIPTSRHLYSNMSKIILFLFYYIFNIDNNIKKFNNYIKFYKNFARPEGFEPSVGKFPRQVNSLLPSTTWLKTQIFVSPKCQGFFLICSTWKISLKTSLRASGGDRTHDLRLKRPQL